MEETPIFKIPKPDGEDPPNGPVQLGEAVDRIEELLATIEELILHPGAAGTIAIVNGTGDPVYKAVTGDVTLSTGGVTAIGNAKVLEAMLGGESVATAKIKALAVTAAKLAAEAVETGKLQNLAVTEAKLAALAVSTAKLANEAVETGKIKNAAVTEAKIANGAVGSSKIKFTRGAARLSADYPLTNVQTAMAFLGGAVVVTPAVNSILEIRSFWQWDVETANVEGTDFVGQIHVGGGETPLEVLPTEVKAPAIVGITTLTGIHGFALEAGKTYPIAMYAAKTHAGNASKLLSGFQTGFDYKIYAS